jgi:D-sedoheptulose 7-phosphate isomerase
MAHDMRRNTRCCEDAPRACGPRTERLADCCNSARHDGFMEFSARYLAETAAIIAALDAAAIERLAAGLAPLRAGGRLFVLGVGGSAAHASHAVNDARKLCGIEAYAPADNVSELTARINDEGWEGSIAAWLAGSRIGPRDAVLVFSVGGGDAARGVSANLVRAVDAARAAGARVFGILGRDGGHVARVADAAVVVPPLHPARVTPHTEGIAMVIWHLLVSHPALAAQAGHWEQVAR